MYKIVCNDLEIKDIYVGHTTDFIRRKTQHKSSCIKKQNVKLYKTIHDNGGWENWSMIEIEKYPCNDFNEAVARERHWYETLNANLNVQYPSRSQKEYYNMNREDKLECAKEYVKNNYEKVLEQNKKYYNKDYFREYYHRKIKVEVPPQ
jgi:hypothetical protein